MKKLLLILSFALLCNAQTKYVNSGLTTEGTINHCGADSGSVNAYVCTNPTGATIGAYRDGAFYSFRATHTNTGSATLAIDGLSATAIKKLGGSTNLGSGDILTNSEIVVRYNGNSSFFELQSPVANNNLINPIVTGNLTVGTTIIDPVTGLPSANVSYSENGTGATARTLQSWQRNFVNGAGFDTLTHAIAAVSSGGELLLPCGTYVVSATVTISGITVTGQGDCTIIQRGFNAGNMIVLNGTNTTIRNLKIDGNLGTYTGQGVTLSGTTGAVVINCTIVNNQSLALTFLNSSVKSRITGNRFSANGGTVISGTNSQTPKSNDDNEISYNTIVVPSTASANSLGIQVRSNTAGSGGNRNAYLHNHIFSGASGTSECMEVGGASGLAAIATRVIGNTCTFTANSYGCYTLSLGVGTVVSQNECNTAGFTGNLGIELNDQTTSIISNNTINGNGAVLYGIIFTGDAGSTGTSSQNVVTANTILSMSNSSSAVGIKLAAAGTQAFDRNIVSNNQIVYQYDIGAGISITCIDTTSCSYNSITGNSIIGPASATTSQAILITNIPTTATVTNNSIRHNNINSVGVAFRLVNDNATVFERNQLSSVATQWNYTSDTTGTRFVNETGTGTPQSVVSATIGSQWLRTDGGTATTLYIKESGTGTSGWVAK